MRLCQHTGKVLGRNRAAALQIVPSADTSGHGTAVAAIAAGNGRGSSGLYRGVACESELMVVKLGIPLADNFPRTTQLMEAVDFVLRTARQLGRPVAVNLSFEIHTVLTTEPVF